MPSGLFKYKPVVAAKIVRVALPRILDDRHQERAVASMAAVEIEAVEPPPHQRVDDRAPEVLERPPADVERAIQERPVGADSVGIHRQAGRQIWQRRPPCPA